MIRPSSGTRGVGAVVLAVAVGLAAGACSKPRREPGPTDAVRLFLAASQDRDAPALYRLLDPGSQARLKAAAAQASAQSGRRKPIAPHELLSAGFRPSVGGDWAPTSFKLLEQSGDTARVEVLGKKPGQRDVVRLVRVQGHWRIALPLPPTPGPAPPSSAPPAR